MNLFGRSADKHRERRWHLIVPTLMGAVGFVVRRAVHRNTAVSLACLSLAAAGVLTCAPLFWSLPTAFLARRRGGRRHRRDQFGGQPGRLRQPLPHRLAEGRDRQHAGRHVCAGRHARGGRHRGMVDAEATRQSLSRFSHKEFSHEFHHRPDRPRRHGRAAWRGSLRRAGYAVHVCDVRARSGAGLRRRGRRRLRHARPSWRRACDVVVCVVVNAAQTEAVLFGADGARRGDEARQRVRDVLDRRPELVDRARGAPGRAGHPLPRRADLRRRRQGRQRAR